MDPVSVFSTVTEKQTERNPNPFFTKEPLEYILTGEFENVPWILGTVEDEGIIRVASKLLNIVVVFLLMFVCSKVWCDNLNNWKRSMPTLHRCFLKC